MNHERTTPLAVIYLRVVSQGDNAELAPSRQSSADQPKTLEEATAA